MMAGWWLAHKAGLATMAILAALSGGAMLHQKEAKPRSFVKTIRKRGDEFQNLALVRVEPEYPEETVFVNQKIIVEVTVDESGDVILARPIFGYPLNRLIRVGNPEQDINSSLRIRLSCNRQCTMVRSIALP